MWLLLEEDRESCDRHMITIQPHSPCDQCVPTHSMATCGHTMYSSMMTASMSFPAFLTPSNCVWCLFAAHACSYLSSDSGLQASSHSCTWHSRGGVGGGGQHEQSVWWTIDGHLERYSIIYTTSPTNIWYKNTCSYTCWIFNFSLSQWRLTLQLAWTPSE